MRRTVARTRAVKSVMVGLTFRLKPEATNRKWDFEGPLLTLWLPASAGGPSERQSYPGPHLRASCVDPHGAVVDAQVHFRAREPHQPAGAEVPGEHPFDVGADIESGRSAGDPARIDADEGGGVVRVLLGEVHVGHDRLLDVE